MGVLAEQENAVPAERHYAVIEVAEMWHLCPDKVREIFEHEPGVLVLGDRNPRHKRCYITLRIPHTVLLRCTQTTGGQVEPFVGKTNANHLPPAS